MRSPPARSIGKAVLHRHRSWTRLAIEIDGELKYTDLDSLRAEKTREDDLRAAGHDFHRAWVDETFADPTAAMKNLRDKREQMRLSGGRPEWG